MARRKRFTAEQIIPKLREAAIEISKRQLVRLLINGKQRFVAEADAVLRSGLETASWVSADDTGARHAASNQYCTQIGDDRFAWFATRPSKSRLNFLELLQAGERAYSRDDFARGALDWAYTPLLDAALERGATLLVLPAGVWLAKLMLDATPIASTPSRHERLPGRLPEALTELHRQSSQVGDPVLQGDLGHGSLRGVGLGSPRRIALGNSVSCPPEA